MINPFSVFLPHGIFAFLQAVLNDLFTPPGFEIGFSRNEKTKSW
jgi:hypothetical protein